jgi:hypothetical protein
MNFTYMMNTTTNSAMFNGTSNFTKKFSQGSSEFTKALNDGKGFADIQYELETGDLKMTDLPFNENDVSKLMYGGIESLSTDEFKSLAKGLADGDFEIMGQFGGNKELQDTFGMGGMDFSKALGDLDVDFNNPNELKRLAEGLQEGGFHIEGQLNGDADISAVIGKLGGGTFTKNMGDVSLDLNNPQ